MRDCFNLPVLTQTWADLTLTPDKEARARFRAIQVGGLLPDGRLIRGQSLDDPTIALSVIGAMCSEQHIKSAEAAMHYAALPCSHDDVGTPFASMNLQGTLAELMARSRDPSDPWVVVQCQFNLSRPIVEIVLIDRRRSDHIGGGIYFGDITAPGVSVEHIRSLSGMVLTGIAKASQAA